MKKYFTIAIVAIIGVITGAAITAMAMTNTMTNITAEYEEKVSDCLATIDNQDMIINGQRECIESLRSVIEEQNTSLYNVMNNSWDRVEYDVDGVHYVHAKKDGILGKLGFTEVTVIDPSVN